ncbi:hypothetical protein Ddye_024145 [Dipteronia dyeriana]|uniref:Uncharacterized protein n=1 Tax=Dipteronia dyeriana TaxID=168575 RepID=A0AAD9TUB9_9ROSI|nr:hypothetical protein Ddye_024145 [Dipteronia dyeriana]
MMVELFVLGCTGVVVFLHGANFFFHVLSHHLAVRSLRDQNSSPEKVNDFFTQLEVQKVFRVEDTHGWTKLLGHNSSLAFFDCRSLSARTSFNLANFSPWVKAFFSPYCLVLSTLSRSCLSMSFAFWSFTHLSQLATNKLRTIVPAKPTKVFLFFCNHGGVQLWRRIEGRFIDMDNRLVCRCLSLRTPLIGKYDCHLFRHGLFCRFNVSSGLGMLNFMCDIDLATKRRSTSVTGVKNLIPQSISNPLLMQGYDTISFTKGYGVRGTFHD